MIKKLSALLEKINDNSFDIAIFFLLLPILLLIIYWIVPITFPGIRDLLIMSMVADILLLNPLWFWIMYKQPPGKTPIHSKIIPALNETLDKWFQSHN